MPIGGHPEGYLSSFIFPLSSLTNYKFIQKTITHPRIAKFLRIFVQIISFELIE